MDFGKFETNTTLEVNGRWFPVDGRGAKILVARINNPKYRERLRAKLGPMRTSLNAGLMDDPAAEEAVVEIMAETILLGWEGFEENGVAVSYSKGSAIKYLTKYKEFRDFVTECATNAANYRASVEESDLGNSKSSSVGTSNGANT